MKTTHYEDDWVVVHTAEVGYGSAGFRGELGYDGINVTPCESLPKNCRFLSAHAPSWIEIEAKVDLELYACLDLSSLETKSGCIFWCNNNYVQILFKPGSSSRPMRIKKGRHLLGAETVQKDGKHSYWAYRKSK